eukprot:scaffold459_cov117-Isochrysis_galbana.AAC.6
MVFAIAYTSGREAPASEESMHQPTINHVASFSLVLPIDDGQSRSAPRLQGARPRAPKVVVAITEAVIVGGCVIGTVTQTPSGKHKIRRPGRMRRPRHISRPCASRKQRDGLERNGEDARLGARRTAHI